MASIDLDPWIVGKIHPKLVECFKNLRREQLTLQKEGIITDHPSLSKISLVAGCDVSYFADGDACAGITVLRVPSLTLIEFVFTIFTPIIDYVPTFLAYREAPGLVEAYKKLQNEPDLILVDGNGILHPYKIGIASHLGLTLNTPTIGVAKQLLLGKVDEQLLFDGKISPIMYKNQELGIAMSTNPKYKPIYVSPGHLISLQTASSLVSRYTKQRIPEPIRLADKLTRDKVRSIG